jgi:hypothetical protein
MNVPEAIIMEICNARYDAGTLTERLTWLRAKLDSLDEYDREYPLVKARFDLAQAQLLSTWETLKKLYKEMYGD